MNISIQVPLGRIQRSINKIELTHIDHLLTGDQKKRVASFYREEAAKRTRYNLEPVWTIPESVQLVKASQRTPQPEPEAAEEVIKDEPTKEPEISTEERKQPTFTQEIDTVSSPDTVVTDSDDVEPIDTEALEIGTSPLSDLDSPNSPRSSPESDPISDLLAQILTRNKGSYTQFKKDVLTLRKFTRDLGDISNTQLKKLIYQTKNNHVKDLRKQYQNQ